MKQKAGLKNTVIALLVCAAVAAGAVGADAIWQKKTALASETVKAAQAEAAVMVEASFAGTPLKVMDVAYAVSDDRGKQHTFSLPAEGTQTVPVHRWDAQLLCSGSMKDLYITVYNAAEQTVFSGSADDFAGFLPPENGSYTFAVQGNFAGENARGTAVYRFTAQYDVRPEIRLNAEQVAQGDVLLVTGDNIKDPASVSVAVTYPYTPVAAATGPHSFAAYLPFNYMREAGVYDITVAADGETFPLSCTVTETDYVVQHLYVEESTQSSTVGNDTARETYNDTMAALDAHFDPTLRWQGTFIQPCEGTITTEYGIKRYVNDSDTPSRHAGIDIACDEGTPVAASGSGVVLFSDWLQVSGNTVVIDHGYGVHTVYLHMASLNCAEGDTVTQRDIIGYVGSTGYSTGPHLHFAVMVGDVSVSPWFLFDGTSGIYELAKQ